MESNIPVLTDPRYTPLTVKGIDLALWCDRQEDKYLVVCPQCHRLISYDSLHALYLTMGQSERKCCQGCQARVSFESNPGLIGLYLDFWFRTGIWPQSPSWLEAVPLSQYQRWAKEIQAGLAAAIAPLMPIQLAHIIEPNHFLLPSAYRPFFSTASCQPSLW